jgi:DNA invertase Pin-like site-specific DNA recombinase
MLSGSAKTARPGLAAMLDYARPGDTVAVAAIDRLGRSVADVTRTIAEFGERRITLRALREGIDTGITTGRAVAAIMATLAELERRGILNISRNPQQSAESSDGFSGPGGRGGRGRNNDHSSNMRRLPVPRKLVGEGPEPAHQLLPRRNRILPERHAQSVGSASPAASPRILGTQLHHP